MTEWKYEKLYFSNYRNKLVFIYESKQCHRTQSDPKVTGHLNSSDTVVYVSKLYCHIIIIINLLQQTQAKLQKHTEMCYGTQSSAEITNP
jgi:hypothetical protein